MILAHDVFGIRQAPCEHEPSSHEDQECDVRAVIHRPSGRVQVLRQGHLTDISPKIHIGISAGQTHQTSNDTAEVEDDPEDGNELALVLL